jgi:hypothetical protein
MWGPHDSLRASNIAAGERAFERPVPSMAGLEDHLVRRGTLKAGRCIPQDLPPEMQRKQTGKRKVELASSHGFLPPRVAYYYGHRDTPNRSYNSEHGYRVGKAPN